MKFVFAFVKGKPIGFNQVEWLGDSGGDDGYPGAKWETFGNEGKIFPHAFNTCGSNSEEGAKAFLRKWLDACGFIGTEIRSAEAESEDGLHIPLPRAEISGGRDPEEVRSLLQEVYLEETGKTLYEGLLSEKVRHNEWITLLGEDPYGEPTEKQERMWCGGTWLILEGRIGSAYITPIFSHHGKEFIVEMVRGYRARRATLEKLREERDAKEGR